MTFLFLQNFIYNTPASRPSRFFDLVPFGGLMKALPSWKLLSSPADGKASEHVPRSEKCIDDRGCFAPDPSFLTDQGAASAMAQLPVLICHRLCQHVRRWQQSNCRRQAPAGVSTDMRFHPGLALFPAGVFRVFRGFKKTDVINPYGEQSLSGKAGYRGTPRWAHLDRPAPVERCPTFTHAIQSPAKGKPSFLRWFVE